MPKPKSFFNLYENAKVEALVMHVETLTQIASAHAYFFRCWHWRTGRAEAT
jgi:hypothetical protein